MSDYVGKSPIPLEQGIATFKQCVKNIEDFYGEPSVTYKSYEELFTNHVRGIENQLLSGSKEGLKIVKPRMSLMDEFFVPSSNPSDPLPPKDLKYTEVCKDVVAYFKDCGYLDVHIEFKKMAKYDGSDIQDWDDQYGVPFSEGPSPGYPSGKPMYNLPQGYKVYYAAVDMAKITIVK